jgi:hypothetical protein
LYALTPDLAGDKPFVDERNTRFGDTGLLISDPKEFLTRIIKSVRGKFQFEYKPVYYYPDNHDFNNLTAFNKPEYFSYQREFRLLLNFQSTEPLIIRIGSLEDISVKIESVKLNELTLKEA